MLTRITGSKNYYPVHSFLYSKQDEKKVFRGPFREDVIQEERQKYILMDKLTDLYLNYHHPVPSIVIYKKQHYLCFEFYGSVTNGVIRSNIFDLIIHNKHKQTFFEILVLRYLLGSGGGSFNNSLYVDGEIYQMALDIPHIHSYDNLYSALFATPDTRYNISAHVRSYTDVLCSLVKKIKQETDDQRIISGCNRLFDIFDMKFIYTNLNSEGPKKRGPKPKNNPKNSSVFIPNYKRTVVEKMKFDNLKVSTSFDPEIDDLSIREYLIAINSIPNPKTYIFEFVWRYFSVQDMDLYGEMIFELAEKKDYLKIYYLISISERTREIFIKAMRDAPKLRDVTWDDLKISPERDFVNDYLKYISRDIRFIKAYLDSGHNNRKEAEINFPEVDLDVKPVKIKRPVNILFNSMLTAYWDIPSSKREITESDFNIDLPYLIEDQQVLINCLKLAKLNYPVHPNYISAIYN